MQKVIIEHNQSLLDVSIQTTGTVNNALKIAQANNISLSDKLMPGTEVIIPDGIDIHTEIVNYYVKNGLKPATDIDHYKEKELGGIGEMEIGNNFIIR